MFGNSRAVTTSQTGMHDRLAEVVLRHAATPFRKPVLAHNLAAFQASMHAWHQAGTPPLILDSGCGVGLSSWHLAMRFPDHFVIGVDQSADRLSRATAWPGACPKNLVRVRAELSDYWRLLHAENVRLARHTLLYPNPWPKAAHLGRRWHGHPVFPTLVALGGIFECRSNWKIYIDECAAALSLLTGQPCTTQSYMPPQVITPFERKYLASGHTLWRCSVVLGASLARTYPDDVPATPLAQPST